jgi:hypothetical protein
MAEEKKQEIQNSMEPSPTSIENDNDEILEIFLKFNKNDCTIRLPTTATLADLRQSVYQLTQIAPGLQKLIFKGILKGEDQTLSSLGLKTKAKVMLVGSSIHDVLQVNTPATSATSQAGEKSEGTSTTEEPLSLRLPHKKIIEKGVPEDAEKGDRTRRDPLPPNGIRGLYNNRGTKVRLTFKTYVGELWISSASSTQKIPFSSIRNITSEPIHGNEDYHIMGLQLGSSENTKYYLYFVPAQYVQAIKNTILNS